MRSMLDHLARARELRRHAAKCQQAAKTSVSHKFGDCYRLLANNYVILAELEEDFVAGRIPRFSKTIDRRGIGHRTANVRILFAK